MHQKCICRQGEASGSGPVHLVSAPCSELRSKVEHLLALTEGEKAWLQQAEGILRTGLNTFFEVGNALLVIKSKRLYRETHDTFEAYCRERWDIGRSYAWRFIGAAERINLLPKINNMPRPANEFQVRPFLKLKAEAFPKVWEQITKRAKNGKVTSDLVQTVLREIASADSNNHTTARPRVPRKKLPLGHVLSLLHEAKQKLQKQHTEDLEGILDEIEELLFSS